MSGGRCNLSPTLSDFAQDPARLADATPDDLAGLYGDLERLPPGIAAKIMPIAVTGCWEWTGARDSRGYGNVKVEGRVRKAHRVIYELVRGPVPPGLECDHRCRVPWCVNPVHVDVVTHVENVRRGAARWVPGARQRAKRRCPRGHSYSKANTYIHQETRGRWCRQCTRERKRAHAPA